MRKQKRQSKKAATLAVDVHCHVFNAQDVPVRQFIELVYLEKYPGGSLLNPLIDLLELIMRFGAPTARQEADELKAAGLVLSGLKKRGTYPNKIRAVSRALKQMWIKSPADRAWVRKHLSPKLRRKFKGKHKILLTSSDLTKTAQYLSSLSEIGTWINFAHIFTKWRWEITQQLASLSASQARDVFLYTPALLDIGVPLQEGNTCPVKEQVEVMSLISQIARQKYAVHPFVAFDPFRAMDDPNTLLAVKDAVYLQGAVGVKIYPPMGFRPMGNSDSFGPMLDEQMKLLLQFCLTEDVPILAHCSFSQYVKPAQGACAAPEAWQALLDTPGYQMLRIDLGHCGGPWDLVANCETNSIWTETVIAMLGAADPKNPNVHKYPNLYADMGDDSFIIGSTQEDRDKNCKLMTQLCTFLNNNKTARTRLLYGSDWSLLAREPGANRYYSSMKQLFCKGLNFSPAEKRGYLGGNAVRFLGLAMNTDGSKPLNRQRLETFRNNNGLDMSMFTKIDSL
jgi:predicted TIM-barrel fold metal-dependent hydrolase